MQTRRFNGLVFDDAMRAARGAGGSEIVFTRQERAVLMELTRRAGALVSRQELHQALATTGRLPGERNVDFIVNRLRARLGDDARAPRFIATQYGEGYVWVAASDQPDIGAAFVVVGPVRGEAPSGLAASLVQGVCDQLTNLLGSGRRAVLAPDWQMDGAGQVAFAIEVSLHAEGPDLHAALALRSPPSGRVIATRRAQVAQGNVRQEAIAIARWARSAIWRHIAMPDGSELLAPSDVPLEIRLSEAGKALTRSPERWREAEVQLRAARKERPDDPSLAILWGLNLFARIIQWPPSPSPGPSVAVLEDEIETLVLANLAGIEDNALLKLGAAKLLFFIDRGHLDLAEQLAEEAFAESTAFAAAYATRGQMLMCRGAIAKAVALYDKGIELAAYASDFHIYLLVLKCTALMADDDRAGVAQTSEELYLAIPESRQMAPFFLSPYDNQLPEAVAAALSAHTLEGARHLLRHLYHTSARHFVATAHRANVVRGLATALRRQFGAEAVPDDIGRLLAAPFAKI